MWKIVKTSFVYLLLMLALKVLFYGLPFSNSGINHKHKNTCKQQLIIYCSTFSLFSSLLGPLFSSEDNNFTATTKNDFWGLIDDSRVKTANCSVVQKVKEQSGGFTPRPLVKWSEDWWIC